MKALDILVAARKLLKARFTTGELAFGGKYCALGAVNRVAHVEQQYYLPKRHGTPVERAVFFLENAVYGNVPNLLGADADHYHFGTIDVNDDDGKTVVIAVFDRAIANCRRRHIATTPFDLDRAV